MQLIHCQLRSSRALLAAQPKSPASNCITPHHGLFSRFVLPHCPLFSLIFADLQNRGSNAVLGPVTPSIMTPQHCVSQHKYTSLLAQMRIASNVKREDSAAPFSQNSMLPLSQAHCSGKPHRLMHVSCPKSMASRLYDLP
eukprot:GHRR01017281.1.p2 GENE.GHRR01017281.1~~GHRR01017281.1.p2  ORF type:complete len:140 (-),score=4.09 GHRR01017281.1:624-1043(-)